MVILLGDAAEVLKTFVDGCISLTVTSPPYDDLRSYDGYSFNFEVIANELYRVTKDGGIMVWIVGDQTLNGSETLTSFKQAIQFQQIGFNTHDTMIHAKQGVSRPYPNRYHQCFEYMFVFSKGSPKTFNPMEDRRNTTFGRFEYHKVFRENDGLIDRRNKKVALTPYGKRYNIWSYNIGGNDPERFLHPATMPEQLAQDHIKSWSNEGDLILDPFAGSGTTLKAAQQLNRKWIGIEINPDYVQLAKKRLTPYVQQQRLDDYNKISC